MKTLKINSGLLIICAMIAIAALGRFFTPVPEMNFTPVGAMALFAGAYLTNKKLAFIVPVVTLLVTDLIIGIYDPITMAAVYGSFILVVVIGMLIKKVSIINVVLASITSSVIFFLITNFATWLSGFCGYSMTLSGLILCYEMALPFFRNEFLATLIYSGVLFGVFELIKAKKSELVKA